jgi:hypothetical protein
MTKDIPKPKKAERSNSFVIPLATMSGLLILFLIYVFWYVSAEDKYYNDRAFRVLSVLSESFAGKVRTIESVLGASAAFDNEPIEPTYTEATQKGQHPTASGKVDADTAAQYVARYLDEYGVTAEQVHANWTKKCREASRDGKLTLSLEDPADFSLRAVYKLSDSAAECKPAKKDEHLEVQTILHPLASVRARFDHLNEGFFEDVLIADADGVVLYQQSKGGVQISDLNDLVRLRPDGSAVVAPTDKPEAPGGAPPRSDGDKVQKQATAPEGDTRLAISKSSGPFSQISGSGNIVNLQLTDASVRLYLQPSPLAIQKNSRPSRLVFCGLRSAKHVQADTLSLSSTLVIWGALVLALVFALGWPLLKVFYVSPKERLQLGQLLTLILTSLVGTVLLTLATLNSSYRTWQDSVSKVDLPKIAGSMKDQIRHEMQLALEELNRLSTHQDLLPSHTPNPKGEKDFWQVAQYFENNSAPYRKTANNPNPPYSYFRYAVLIDVDGWQRAKFTAEWPTPRVNSRKETYFQEARLSNFDTFPQPAPRCSTLGNPQCFRLDLSTSPNTGEFLPVLSAPYSDAQPSPPSSQHSGSPKLNYQAPLQEKLLVMKFESLVDPVLPPGFGFAVVDRAGKVQFHSNSQRNLLEDFLQETQFNPELLSLLQQGGSDFFRARYLGRAQVLYVTPLELFQHPPLSLIVFRDDDRATAGNKAVVVVYCLLALFYVLFLWGTVTVYFYWRKADYPLQGIWPTLRRQESYIRVGLTDLILLAAFLSRDDSPDASYTAYFALALGLLSFLFPLAELAERHIFWKGSIRFFVLVYLGAMLYFSYTLGSQFFHILFIALALLIWSSKFSSAMYTLRRFPVRWKILNLTYTFVAISLLLSVVVGPCIGFFSFAFETVERRALQVDQIELAGQISERQNRIHRYYNRIHAPGLEDQRQADLIDRYDLAFFNCIATREDVPTDGKALKDSSLEEKLGDVAEMFQSQTYSGLLELERTEEPRQFEWSVSTRHASGRCAELPTPQIVLHEKFPQSDTLVASAIPLWPGFIGGGRALLVLSILFLILWIYMVTVRVFLIDWEDAPNLEIIKAFKDLRGSTIIIGHPKSGKSSSAAELVSGVPIDFAELVATEKWEVILPADSLIILDHFECGIDDPGLNLKKLEFLERLVRVQHRKVILLSTVDPMFYLVSGFPEVLSSNPDDWSSSVQILDRWASILSDFHKASFEDKSIREFSRNLGIQQDKLLQPEPNQQQTSFSLQLLDRIVQKCSETAGLRTFSKLLGILQENLLQSALEKPKSSFALMLIDCVRQECDHTASLRRIGQRLLSTRLQNPEEQWESSLRKEVIEDVLDRADAYYRSLWATCTKNERLVLYQLSKDGWANPKNRKEIRDLIRRGLVVRNSGFHVMNRSFRQFVLDYQYPEEVAAWDQEVKSSTWRAVRSSLLATGLVFAVWLIYSQQQVVHIALGYVGVVGGAAATVGSLVAALRNRSARSAPDASKSA